MGDDSARGTLAQASAALVSPKVDHGGLKVRPNRMKQISREGRFATMGRQLDLKGAAA
jgi:hypothetical protein